MIKNGIFILALLISITNLKSQEVIHDITNKYFPINPFNNSFSEFTRALLSDSFSVAKTINKRTDSTLFFFVSEYPKLHPFSFKSTRNEIRLAEIEEVKYKLEKDTVLFYQVSGYADNNKGGDKDVKAEFNSFFRDYHNDFFKTTYKKITEDEKTIGEIYNFTPRFAQKSAAVISWMIISEKESIFTITIKLIVKENQATSTQLYTIDRSIREE